MNLKELSETLGLSQTTVSRALNGYPEVSEATREKVRLAAEKFNYRPNTRARGLATGRTHAVGHVIPLSTKHEVVNPVFTDFIAGASEIYSRENYDMHLTVVPDDEEAEAYRTIAIKGSADGVIVHGPRQDDPRITLLQNIGMPFVVHGRSGCAMEDTYTWVDVDNEGAFKCATDYLISLGHERIGILNGLENMDFAAKRREGFRAALKDHGITEVDDYCRAEEMTEDFGFTETSRMLALDTPPTALLASSMIVGIGVRRACDAAGLRLGRDLSLIIHDDDLSYLRNGGDTPIYTATRSSVRNAGRICGELLMKKIANPDTPHEQVLLDPELIIGQTTGPAQEN